MQVEQALESHIENVEKKLDPLVQKDFMGDEGKNWLIAATDPFHDTPLKVSGFPDSNVAGSVVQVVRKTMTVVKPAAIPAGTQWDCHVVNWPIPITTQYTPFRNIAGLDGSCNFGIDTGSYQTVNIGGLAAYAVPTGTGSIYTVPGTNRSTTTLDMSEYYQGEARVIGLGFEVANTTSELYKQGSVIVYRSPTLTPVNSNALLRFSTSGTYALPGAGLTDIECDMIPTPPLTPADALLLPGSHQWEAKYGCYCVSTMNGVENPVSTQRPRVPVVHSGLMPAYGELLMENFTTTVVNGVTFYSTANNSYVPWNISGAYFTGLSDQTTLTINYCFIIERFPSIKDSQLVVLASPSPGFDTSALDMYSEVMEKMPVGVMFKENPFGEWFEDVVNEVAGFAAPALGAASLVFPEFAPILGPLGAGVGALKSQVLEPRAKIRREKKQAKKLKKNQQNARKV